MKTRTVAVIALLTAACAGLRPPTQTVPVAAASEPERSTQQMEAAADEAMHAGRIDEAERLWLALEGRGDASPVVLVRLGAAAERRDALSEAERRYTAALALEPTNVQALLHQGRLRCALGHPEEAVALYDAAAPKLGPSAAAALAVHRSIALRLAGRLDEAEASARRALLVDRGHAPAYQALALVALERGQESLAERLAARAHELDAKAAAPLTTLGQLALRQGQVDRALDWFRRAAALDAAAAAPPYDLGAVALRYRDFESAERAFRRVTELAPSDVDALLGLAYALDGQKRNTAAKGVEAGRVFEAVLAREGERREALCGAAWAYAVERSTWDRALAFFERCRTAPGTGAAERTAVDARVAGLRALKAADASKAAPAGAPAH